MATLSAFDMIVLLALAGGLIVGFMRGFVQEILSLAALVAALVALRFVHGPLTTLLDPKIGEAAAPVLAFTIIMVVVWGGGKFIAIKAGQTSRASVVGGFDRLLGAGFGTLKALLIMTAGFILFNLAYDLVHGGRTERPAWMLASRTYPMMRATSAMLSGVIADRMAHSDAQEGTASGSNSAASTR